MNEIGGTLKPMQPAAMFKIFFNQKIKEGRIPSTPADAMLNDFKKFVESSYAKKEAGVKTEKQRQTGKQRNTRR